MKTSTIEDEDDKKEEEEEIDRIVAERVQQGTAEQIVDIFAPQVMEQEGVDVTVPQMFEEIVAEKSLTSHEWIQQPTAEPQMEEERIHQRTVEEILAGLVPLIQEHIVAVVNEIFLERVSERPRSSLVDASTPQVAEQIPHGGAAEAHLGVDRRCGSATDQGGHCQDVSSCASGACYEA